MVRWRSVSPAPAMSRLPPVFSLLSLMGPNVARGDDIIKHVFERVSPSTGLSAAWLTVIRDTLAQMFVFEHTGDYRFEHPSDMGEGADMTILHDHDRVGWPVASPRRVRTGYRHRSSLGRLPAPSRPVVAPLRYRGSGLAVSAAPHRRLSGRKGSTPVTLALAVLAALITVWLGLLAQSGAERAAPALGTREQLAVVYVLDGESLRSLAGRVAPDSPVDRVVDRIRDLNQLDSSAIETGQSLIAPLG